MKKILTLILAPLLVAVLSAFSVPKFPTDQITKSKDSTTVNVQFSPAQIYVEDNRATSVLTNIVEENTESNTHFATAIEKLSSVLLQNAQERRCESLMDRITQQTGLTIKEVEIIIHKKRVYDIISYTLFLLFISYLLVNFSRNSNFANIINIKEWSIKTISSLTYLGLLYLFYIILEGLLLGPNYPIIKTIINSSS